MGFVYLIGEVDNPNTYKIGVTNCKDINTRKKKLQTGNSQELFIKDYFESKYPFKVEGALHRHFMNKKLINEWFSLDDNDVKEFTNICMMYENNFDALKDNPFFNKQKKAPIF